MSSLLLPEAARLLHEFTATFPSKHVVWQDALVTCGGIACDTCPLNDVALNICLEKYVFRVLKDHSITTNKQFTAYYNTHPEVTI